MMVGSVSTYSADSVITDSSSAATAFATGYKTTNGFISVGPAGDSVLSTLETPPEKLQYSPLATVLEGSKLEGKATGLVATVRVTHATPAAFASHVDDRDNENEYLLDMADPLNPVLRIGDAELPVSKNLLIKDGVTHELNGIVVYAPATDKVYVPYDVLSLV